MNAYSQMINQRNPYYNSTLMNATPQPNNIVWVQGIEGAKALQLNPNSMMIMLDSEVDGKMYIKVSDSIGMSKLRIFNYTEELPSEKNNVTVNTDLDLSQYVKKDELGILIKELLTNEQSVSTASGAESAGASKPKAVTIIKKQS